MAVLMLVVVMMMLLVVCDLFVLGDDGTAL